MEVAIPFKDLIESLCTKHNGNQKSMRTAAVALALVEVIKEKLGTASSDDVSPAAMYASTVNALTSSLTSDNIDSIEQSPQSSLLEILSKTIPYVSSSNPNLYIHQFNNISRVLRGIISSIPSPMHSSPDDQSSISAGWNSLLRQTIRAASTTLNGILILENTQHLEKEVLKCFHFTILQHFDDPRAKVRRQAHACANELLQLSSSLASESSLSSTSLIPDQIAEYSHQIILQYISRNDNKLTKSNDPSKGKVIQLLHLLSYLESALSALHLKGRLTLGQDLIKVLEEVVKNNDGTPEESDIMIVSNTLGALLQIFDSANREFVNGNDEKDEEEDSFCAKAWSSLLQLNTSFMASTKNLDERGSECRIAYTHCIVAITLRMLQNYGDLSTESSIISALLHKLLPLSLKSVLYCIGDDEMSSESAQSVCAELGRIIRSSDFINLISIEKGNGTIDECVTVMQILLRYRFHKHWDCSLPLLASFVVGIVQGMISTSGSNESTTVHMKNRAKPIIGSLIQLHADSTNTSSKQSVESAVQEVVRGIGLEIFMGLVDLSLTGKGIVSNERAWILSVLKKSIPNQTNPYRPRLAFFQTHILGIARKCDAITASEKLTVVESSIHKSYVVDLWSLFPSFCLDPIDVDVTFPTLAQILIRAMSDERYPQLMVRC